jgi:hypothetical protein
MTKPTFNELKRFIENGDVKNTAVKILQLYLSHDDFQQNLLLSGCLPEPLSRNFSEKKLNTYLKGCNLIIKYLKKQDVDTADFREICVKPALIIYQIYKNSQSNNARLAKNEFLKYPFTKQIQMLCSLIESQYIYSKRKIEDTLKDQKIVTGMEQELSINEKKLSISDNLEGLLEILDTLIRLLHFNARDKIERDEFKEYSDISPYNLPCVEEIIYLAAHRKYLEKLWEKVKYQSWSFELRRGINNEIIYYYKAPNSYYHKKEIASVIRQKYHNVVDEINEMVRCEQRLENGMDYDNLIDIEDPMTLFKVDNSVFSKSSNHIKVNITWKHIRDNLGGIVDNIKFGEKRDITINELMLGFEYLTVLAELYQEKAHAYFNDTESTLRKLTPIFKIETIVKKFSQAYNLSENKSQAIINLLTYRPNPILDIFSQPLIYVGNGRVIFTPYLILQMNYYRIIEQHISYWDIDVSQKGKDLERDLKIILNISPHVQINQNEVAFVAQDGKMVEYDLIALFNNRVMLIEIKNLKRPFSPKEIYQREKEILYGVEQVKRRAEILYKQWEKIKKLVSIKLPDEPPKKYEIIKIVCTNIYNFSGRVYEGVYITDFSALTKFFLSPRVEVFELRGTNQQKVGEDILWEGEPTVERFIDYLKMPIAMERIFNCLEEVPRPLFLINDDDYPIAMQDFYLSANPYIYHG